MSQYKFFEQGDEQNQALPTGLHYDRELIDARHEAALVARVSQLPFREFEFHGYKGKRRVVSFGWQYEFSGAGKLHKADDIPEFLLPLRERAASFAGLEAAALQHVLVIEYGRGAGIGWHRDKPVFGQVVGVSLLASCIIRFRRKIVAEGAIKTNDDIAINPNSDPLKRRKRAKLKSTWERANLFAEPRSAYHLNGPARYEWEHSILRVDELRYSITFRNMRGD